MENRLVLVKGDGVIVDIDRYDDVDIEWKGKGSLIKIHEGSIFKKARMVMANDSYIEIQKTYSRGLRNITIDCSGRGVGRKLLIGPECSSEGVRFAMANESNIDISLGSGCMLSANITFRGSDGHTIFDLDTGDVLNRTRPIRIGNNVWIGAGVTLVKGAVVMDGSILGTGTLVSRKFDRGNVVIAGVPGAILKENIGWSRNCIDRYVSE